MFVSDNGGEYLLAHGVAEVGPSGDNNVSGIFMQKQNLELDYLIWCM